MVSLIFRFFVCCIFLIGCKERDLKSIQSLEEKCVQYDASSCLKVASFYAKEQKPLNRLKVLKALDWACKYGDTLSCEVIARSYFAIQKNDLAIRSLGLGCQGGSSLLCFRLAKEYFKGQYIKKDHNRSYELFTKACYGGNLQGCKAAIAMAKQKKPNAPEILGLQKQMSK